MQLSVAFHGLTPFHPAGDPGHAFHVTLIDRRDRKARVAHRFSNRPGQMAPAHQPFPYRVDPFLPALNAGIRGAPVLKKQEQPARFQDAPQFRQDLDIIIHRAERVSADDRIEFLVGKGDILPEPLPDVSLPALARGLFARVIEQFSGRIDPREVSSPAAKRRKAADEAPSASSEARRRYK